MDNGEPFRTKASKKGITEMAVGFFISGAPYNYAVDNIASSLKSLKAF